MKYQDISNTAEDAIKQLYSRGFMFQHDGSSSHTLRSIRKGFTEHDWRVSNWNLTRRILIENIWGLMKRAMEIEKQKNIQD